MPPLAVRHVTYSSLNLRSVEASIGTACYRAFESDVIQHREPLCAALLGRFRAGAGPGQDEDPAVPQAGFASAHLLSQTRCSGPPPTTLRSQLINVLIAGRARIDSVLSDQPRPLWIRRTSRIGAAGIRRASPVVPIHRDFDRAIFLIRPESWQSTATKRQTNPVACAEYRAECVQSIGHAEAILRIEQPRRHATSLGKPARRILCVGWIGALLLRLPP